MAKISFSRQLWALMKRNFLIKKRSKAQTIQEFVYPLYFVFIIAIIRISVSPKKLPAIPDFPENRLDQFAFPTDNKSHILVSPNTSAVNDFMKELILVLSNASAGSEPRYRLLNTNQDAEDEYDKNPDVVSAGIHFADGSLQSYDYTVRMPYSVVPNTDSPLYQSEDQCRNPEDFRRCTANSYLNSGFSLLQTAIDTLFIRRSSGKDDFSLPELFVRLFPKDAFTPDISYIQTMAAIFFVIAYSPFVSYLMVNLVSEKEKKIKEAMRMMGMKDAALWSSWGLTYGFIIVVVTALCTLLAWASRLLQNSNMFLFYLILFLYGMTIITIGFALTPFFNKAETAGGLASLATMLFSLLYLAVGLTREPTPTGPVSSIPVTGQWFLCLLSPVAFALAIDQISRDGMHFDSMHYGQFPLYASMTMLAVDFVLYGILALYFDNVIPSEYGKNRPLWFCLMPSYWCPKKKSTEMLLDGGELNVAFYPPTTQDNSAATQPDIEPIAPDLEGNNALRIFNLKKTFKVKKKEIHAVDDISVDIYEGQITALLGHNGAGKTTLLNVLTGLTSATSGSATLFGYDVSDSNDMDQIRCMTGVCSQHNILFDTLTCKEHLQFYGGIRGLSGKELEAEIERTLNDVDLMEKPDTPAGKLSGGQKRKLTFATALIGDPKILFLDEPTAGMDPYSRRHIWKVLKDRKPGKLIMLTTHFMDEADILADRKIIISKGKVKCVGSSLFLKNRFGVGYHLGLVVETDSTIEPITELVQSHVMDASINRHHGQELIYTLPISSVSNFAGLFGALEKLIEQHDRSHSMGIKSFGVSLTSLEEVFLKIGVEEGTEDDDADSVASGQTRNDVRHVTGNPGDDVADRNGHDAISMEEPADNNGDNNETCLHPSKAGYAENLTSQRFWALFKIRWLLILKAPGSLFFRVIMPVIFIFIGTALQKYVQNVPSASTPEPLQMLPGLYAKMLYAEKDSKKPENPNMTYSVSPPGGSNVSDFIASLYSQGIGQTYVSNYSSLVDLDRHNLGVDIKIVEDIGQDMVCNLTALYNGAATHSVPVIINIISNSLLKMSTTSLNNITVSSQTWPNLVPGLQYDNSLLSSTILLGMALAIIPTGMAMGIARERITKVRGQLRISGITLNMYWASIFIPDVMQFSCVCLLSLVALLAFQVDAIMHGPAILCLILVYVFYMPVSLLCAYLWSFPFNTPETAQLVIPNIFMSGGFIPLMGVAMTDMFGAPHIAVILHYIFTAIDPVYIIYGAIYYIFRVHYIAVTVQGPNPELGFADYFDWYSHIPICFVLPTIHIIWMYFLLRLLEVRHTGGDWNDVFWCGAGYGSRVDVVEENPNAVEDEESDVAEERRRVENIDVTAAQVPVVITQRLRKEFKEPGKGTCFKKKEKVKVVVKNASFGVEMGEVFGLLGPNGAGKTTTLNMIIAEEGPTNGKIYVAGHDIRSSLSEAFQTMGYCPQHDALWEPLTLRAHLECYAAIQGVRKADIPGVINYYLKNLHLRSHEKKNTKKLSGGTKRKLTYIISMLGEPQVVLMDEPSTGMDPKSKRFIWDIISSSFTNTERGAILTTHSMEEADALCSRLAIMVNGQLECIGSTQHLKNKFGSGYTLEVKLNVTRQDNLEQRMEQLDQFVLELFPDAVKIESFSERSIYKVPQTSVLAISAIFTALESAKERFGLEEYSFSQATLEQVFLQFAKLQIDHDVNADEINTHEENMKETRSHIRGPQSTSPEPDDSTPEPEDTSSNANKVFVSFAKSQEEKATSQHTTGSDGGDQMTPL